ncbi:MAG: alpha-D-ribose 1-methylphosphonate 5-triphosphate diphosphatase [Rhodobacter sp.]|nr:alpha-D-ribose 1-methylphosphonate 5-triphosphate diphosphatase [Rhodobacter sp.]
MPDRDSAETGADVVLANARLVLQDEILRGGLIVKDGVIAAIDQGTGIPQGAIDCEGDYVAPGLIELHTDNLERHIQPRPGVTWPHDAAILAHDAELAGAGITTVFDAMRVGSILESKSHYRRYARGLASELLALRTRDILKISHFLHLRAEICSETLIEEMEEFGPDDRVRLVSLMDHTPGQRQFRDHAKLKRHVMGKNNLSESEFEAHIARLARISAENGAANEAGAVRHARRYGATLASHDDETAEHVRFSVEHGVTVAEFPTTVEAANACHRHDIAVMMGAPNLVRGGSHSGNVSAVDLAGAGRLDILSSDYVPAALLLATVQLAHLWDDLPRAVATVTATPAERLGLDDRGRIAVGLRADLIRFSDAAGVPLLRGVWSRGMRAA